jgi:hypothetical protein
VLYRSGFHFLTVRPTAKLIISVAAASVLCICLSAASSYALWPFSIFVNDSTAEHPGGMPRELAVPVRGKPPELIKPQDHSKETQAEADERSHGCISAGCHVGIEDMHNGAVTLGCVDCHGGDANTTSKDKAHVHPLDPAHWTKLGEMPVRSYAMLNAESPEFVRFINPSDLRAARLSCGSNGCHASEVDKVRHSPMANTAMLWGSALYANGEYPEKVTHFGEAYTEDGRPARLITVPPPTPEQTIRYGIAPYLEPLASFEATQPGDLVRIFERGDDRASNRGMGTNAKVDPVFIGLSKTQLLDPNLWFLGTNDHAGDFRSSGCAACHVIYGNDRDPIHSGQYAKYGNLGHSYSDDKSIAKDVSGFPIKHQFTTSIPSSQCIICHMHGGTTVLNSYYGTLWSDDESDGDILYPPKDQHLTQDQIGTNLMSNPQAAGLRGNWDNVDFLNNAIDLNPRLKKVQFADFHGHGWLFRYVYKTDRHGNMLDHQGNEIPFDAPDKFQRGIKLMDIHAEKGMQCADCHFENDAHGNGRLYAEGRAAISIRCEDCHGTFNHVATLKGSGNAAKPEAGEPLDLRREKTEFGRRFTVRSNTIVQTSSMERSKRWNVMQLIDVDNPASPHFNKAASYAHTLQKDGTWGKLSNVSDANLAHPDSRMACQTCHSSWSSGCFGCHLQAKVDTRRPMLHNDGAMTFAWASYNAQTVRPESLMLGLDGIVTGNRYSPVRSASGAALTLYDANREVIIDQQQLVSSEGFSGQAFTTYVPHTVRVTETKKCTDCHISAANDNNALMAHLLLQGTNFVNFIGRYAWVGEGTGGLDGVRVTELDEPQAVFGSDLHKNAYPDEYKAFEGGGAILHDAFHHRASNCLSIQARGEYLYTAEGPGGMNVYDIADIDNKAFSQPLFSSPFSPLGQRTYIKTKFATSVALPTTMVIDTGRPQRPENLEQKVPQMYKWVFITDKYEGLITVDTLTLYDGNPENNFFQRGATFNPNGILNGAVNMTVAGNYGYISCDAGVVVVDVSNPMAPRVVTVIGAPAIVRPRAVSVQFRYAFVVDSQGLKVIDITVPEHPEPVEGATVAISDARNLYVARTYAYVAGGSQGLVIVNVERPEHPQIDQVFNAGGEINDLNDVKLGMANIGLFAYLADGKNGMKVVQLLSPDVPGYLGFSPRPIPQLIARFPTSGPAMAISKGLDRDRGVDESGNQLSVFDRLGSRPMTLDEMQRLYLHDGKVYTVSDEPPVRGIERADASR